jgi:2-methylcitrate dehydratase
VASVASANPKLPESSTMSRAEQLAAFVNRASFEHMSAAAREQLKICVLDSQGCALGALSAEPIQLIRHRSASLAELLSAL